MNAPHPIRALHGHLVGLAPNLNALAPAEPVGSYERNRSDGELNVGITGLDGLVESLTAMAWHVERAVERGAGLAYDLDKLERIRDRIATAHQKVELSAGRLTAKLAGAR